MDLQEAINIVSYKTGLKKGLIAAEQDSLLCVDTIKKALHDQQADTITKIAAKDYLNATKTLKLHKIQQAKIANENWLAENAKLDRIVVTESGLQYKVEVLGNGARPNASSEVTVHYRGSLINGREFDSSYVREKPSTFKINKVILGWKEGLTIMPIGSKYTFYIPQHLAYGERGLDSKVPAYSTLIFEVELISESPG